MQLILCDFFSSEFFKRLNNISLSESFDSNISYFILQKKFKLNKLNIEIIGTKKEY